MNSIKVQQVFLAFLVSLLVVEKTLACPNIANCEALQCITSTTSRCTRCHYDRGHNIQAYQLSSNGRTCTQLCSWRPDSTFCYPGRCTHNTPSSCTCAPNFGGTNCLTINAPPTMHYCLGKLKRMVNGQERDTVEAPCTDSTIALSTVWTNLRFDSTNQIQIEAEWETSFQRSIADWPGQYYIHSYRTGVISASVDWWLERGGTRVVSGTIPCMDGGISRDNPKRSMHDCDKSEAISVTPQHGDSLYFTTKSTNGGYVRIRNYDSPSGSTAVNPPVYYSGREVSHTAYFTFDMERPYHCSVSGGCTDNMLDRGAAFTKNSHINLRWSGWRDDNAGIGEYEYEVFLLQPLGAELQERYPPITGGKVAHDVTETSVVLNEPGVYSVVLTAEDSSGPNDGNFITARRFLIFDNHSTVETDTSGHFPLWVDSAFVANNSTWQNNSAGNDQKVVVKWPGHFYNHFHHNNKFLNAIREHHPPIAPGYEELTGQPPATRSREAVPNAKGVTMFQAAWGVDHEGGRTLSGPPGNWMNVANVTSEEQELDIARQDGDTIRVWVRAFDVMGNVAEDNVTVHVDSSPPILDGMLLFFQTQSVPAIKISFTAYDDHSGLHRIRWELRNLTDTKVEGHLAVRRKSVTDPECLAPQCTCVPIDEVCYLRNSELVLDADMMTNHQLSNDQPFYLIVTATNNAMLQTRTTYTVTADMSLLSAIHLASPNVEHGIYAGVAIGAVVVGIVLGVLATILIQLVRIKKATEESEIYEDVVNRNATGHQRTSGYGEYDMPMGVVSPSPPEESTYQELKPAVYAHLRKT